MALHPAPTIVLQLDRESAKRGFLQRLAGELVWCDLPLTSDATDADLTTRPRSAPDRTWTAIYDGPGLVAGGLERIRSARGDLGSYRVTHADGENFILSSDGSSIRRQAPPSNELPLPDISRALGAPLALALALREIYLLHASAIAFPDGSVIALTAVSGGGKSTLAGAASAHLTQGLRRVADDQLPVRLGRSPAALPHFPQLKLRPQDQYPADASPAVAFRALVELQVDPACDAAELVRETGPEAIQSLVRATVASKLFDREMLTQHFNACASAALVLPVYRLRYPHALDRLDEALALLTSLPSVAPLVP
ncbi:MAG: hypothetical protein ABIU84_14005 [Thermoanaerobaculia bacterium]